MDQVVSLVDKMRPYVNWKAAMDRLDASYCDMDEWPDEWKDAFNKACGEAQMRILRERFHLTPDECYESAK